MLDQRDEVLLICDILRVDASLILGGDIDNIPNFESSELIRDMEKFWLGKSVSGFTYDSILEFLETCGVSPRS